MPESSPSPGSVAVIGAGPAGLTAAYQLGKADVDTTVFEATDVVGGISQTVERDGWRFDIGGHRFFTKVTAVEDLWHEILPAEDFLTRGRMSRLFYRGKFYDYPLKPLKAMSNLGFIEAIRCGFSYLWAQIRPPKDQSNFETFMAANYGWRLYGHFFKTYTEKVWGIDASDISADWGAQRIKGMSLWKAVWEPVRSRFIGRRDKGSQVTSLIEEFEYPKLGPGMMWEKCRDLVLEQGNGVVMQTKVVAVRHADGLATSVETQAADGSRSSIDVDHVISSMPITHLLKAMDPAPPTEVIQAADDLTYRDFLTVALVIPEEHGFPDNWIYVHSPDVKLGRIQNFGSWSPHMVKEGRTCLGLEYFVFEGDDFWNTSDEELIEIGKREIASLGLLDSSVVEAGYVFRMPKAYPTYDETYKENVAVLRTWLEDHTPNVHPVGRNGMHKYNNQDHSMYTAMLTVENLLGADHDIWSVNVEGEYHEESSGATGRDAPVIPKAADPARKLRQS